MGLSHLPQRSRTRRRAVAALAALPLVGAAFTPRSHAQLLRSFPEKARLARLEMRIFPEALLDGESVRLAAAARIHDADNRIVMPASLSGTHDVLVENDASGQIGRVWILTPEELAAARERAKSR
ncbi:MAG: hypothetical protein H3C59_07130 [Burkholderiaceae bacterium]|nr:hypothetical protein [Burkholderiaceae bacterium]MCD6673250.1 hypothetical protein [Burkholderiaceae bacterium]